MIFEEKCFSCYVISTIKLHCLIDFTSGDIEPYVYCNYLFSGVWHHTFWNQPYLPYQSIFLRDLKIQDKGLNISRTKKSKKV